ncbi:hypothetical protein F5Y14DRAFT_204891 [Nemania sp. NC0429]|nr:hypothetical protein F5Y14DRAFT_204891 [Nemania sp. NC0429]
MPVLDALGLRASTASASRSASKLLHETISSSSPARAHAHAHGPPRTRHLLQTRNPRNPTQIPIRPQPRTQIQARTSRRPYSTTPPDPPPPVSRSRATRILTSFSTSRFIPSRLRASLSALRSAPLSHVGAFLLLHELTAVLPIFGLTYAFHALDWVPTSWVLGPWAAWAGDGLRRYVPYFRRKGWFGLEGKEGKEEDGEAVLESELREEVRREQEKEQQREGKEGGKGILARLFGARDTDAAVNDPTATSTSTSTSTISSGESTGAGHEKRDKAAAVWHKVKNVATADNTEKGYKIGVQIAAAYTITKLLLVPRLALSLWLTPWLAMRFVGLRRALLRKRS